MHGSVCQFSLSLAGVSHLWPEALSSNLGLAAKVGKLKHAPPRSAHIGGACFSLPCLANETKMAYPFVRSRLTKGFCVQNKGQQPALGPLHRQNLWRGDCQGVRATAAPAESSGAPGCRPTPARTGEPVPRPAGRPGFRSTQPIALHLRLRSQGGGALLSNRRDPVLSLRPAAL